MNTRHVLIVEDDADMRQLLEDELGAAGWTVTAVGDGAAALAASVREHFDVVVTDVRMPVMGGEELLARLLAEHPTLPIVVMTAFGSVESAVEAMRAGAYHYVTKPFRMDTLIGTLGAAIEERRVHAAVFGGGEAAPDSLGLVAESAPMRRLVSLVSRAALVDSPVLVRGESGTGKELVARALHENGPRRAGPFVPVNCSAIPEALLESLLFGHRRGAFTDAREDREGFFQAADGGTLFLDEIGDMPLALQAKLLRTLQDSRIQPLGATSAVEVNVRVVAATHRDLEHMCATGAFRQDLYYRLNVIPLVLPPLRERPEDLVPLATLLLARIAARHGRDAMSLSREAIERMRARAWPGNVRELENLLERATVFSESDVIGPEHFPASPSLLPGREATEGEIRSLSEVEREQIERALRSVQGNKSAAARMLGLDRKTLYRKIELYGLGAGS
ncbi:MAG: sigma-54 dependent transcriptional regulator [Candidatus Eisenbacteria bacterium]